jgi:hypothetical protein
MGECAVTGYATVLSQGIQSQYSMRSLMRHAAVSCLGTLPKHPCHYSLKCVFCHYVFDDQVAAFDALIRELISCGQFVDTQTALEMIEGSRRIDGQYFHLSFDDGFKNIVVNALPVLRKYNVPSLFFVPTAFVSASYEKVFDYCLRIAQYRNPIEMCSWEDLKRAQDLKMEIGSHTRTHARFSELASDEARMLDEFIGSKADIEAALGTPCTTISWPYGRIMDANDQSVLMTQEVGYRACFGAFRGRIQTGTGEAFRIPRNHFEVQWPRLHIRHFLLR